MRRSGGFTPRKKEPWWERWLTAFFGSVLLVFLIGLWISPVIWACAHGLDTENYLWVAAGVLWLLAGMATLFTLEEWKQ